MQENVSETKFRFRKRYPKKTFPKRFSFQKTKSQENVPKRFLFQETKFQKIVSKTIFVSENDIPATFSWQRQCFARLEYLGLICTKTFPEQDFVSENDILRKRFQNDFRFGKRNVKKSFPKRFLFQVTTSRKTYPKQNFVSENNIPATFSWQRHVLYKD